ncbi:MAG: polysaccharide deacetylase family protein [Methylomarinum sp.]|nr:polysaccharide deacetylase family protein [Methylomarinum sp.]
MQSLILFALRFIATLVSGFGKNKKLFILIYHRVLDESDYMRPAEVDKKVFTWQMNLLSNYFNVLPLDEALEKIETGMLPSRAVSITFDDGYSDNYLNALPILKKYDLKATFFIASGYLNGGMMWNDQVIESIRRMTSEKLDLTDVGFGAFSISDEIQKSTAADQIINKIKHLESNERQDIADFISSKVKKMPTDLMMTDEQLIKLHQAGMEIGGHTVSHPIMANLDADEVKKELKNNKQTLEKLLNTSLRFFAYPNGKPNVDYKPEQIEQVKLQGYKGAVSTEWGVVGLNSDIFQLKRFTPWDTHPVKFMLRMIMRYKLG